MTLLFRLFITFFATNENGNIELFLNWSCIIQSH